MVLDKKVCKKLYMTHPCYLVYSPPKVQFENFSRPMVPLTIEYPCVSNERTNILLKKYL